MTRVPFDTYAAVKRLREASFDEGQAEALIRAVTEAQVRADIATRGDMTEAHHALKADTSPLRNELTQAISDLCHELKQDISDLRNELQQDVSALESCFIRWMFVQAIGLTGLTVTLVDLLS